MKDKKRNLYITIAVVVGILVGSGIYFILNYSPSNSSLSIVEKKWITDNTNKIIDVYVYNDMPIYGYNGEGITFDYLDYISKNYNINFNKISYNTDKLESNYNMAFLQLSNDEKVTNRDILICDDHYVLLSLEDKDIDLGNVDKIGVLKSDSAIIKNYFSSDVNISEYEKESDLVDSLSNKNINYIILPNIGAMDIILENKLKINYHISDLKKKFVLRANDSNPYQVMKKIYREYKKDKYNDSLVKNYLNIYFKKSKTDDVLVKNLNSKVYKYGYVVNMPYEDSIDDEFVGTVSNYLDGFEKSTGVEIDVVKFNTVDDLKSAMVSGEVDLVLGNFSYDKLNVEHVMTRSINDLNYVVVSKDDYNVNSIKGFSGNEVSVVGSSKLYEVLSSNKIGTKVFKNTDDLIRNIDDYSIAIMDKETYLYYKNNRLSKYKIIVEDSTEGYRFLLNKSNEPFNSLFSYYVSAIDYQDIRYLYNTDQFGGKNYTIFKVLLFIISLLLFLGATLFLVNKRNVTNSKIGRDDKLKFVDPMTSLKNRNYLNANIYNWDENVIYPQSVIIIDVNRVREINNKLGREAGDEIIKRVASILINNQLENTDIVRTGGDEFLIYMVGYEEDDVNQYMRKLANEMKNIPNSYGVEVGYSMIRDEVKSVDDAINEAIVMMSKTKDKGNNG